MTLFLKHQPLLEKAIKALHERVYFAGFPEHPAPAVYGETADADGQAKFKALLSHKFEELKQSGASGWGGQEESPYLREPLKISYPMFTVDTLIDNATRGFHQWRKINVETRAGILLESLDRMKQRFFEIAYATMAMVTDYDCWKVDEEHVTVEMVIDNLKKNAVQAKRVVVETIPLIPETPTWECHNALRNAIMTDRKLWPAVTKTKLKPILEKYL